MTRIVFWDFDGTLIPFDSEQYLLESLFGDGRSPLRAWGARLFVHGDRRGWHPGLLKVLYGRCLRGVPLSALDPIAEELAAHIAPPDREALCALAEDGPPMVLLSCGTADLSQRTLRAARLDCFSAVEANQLLVNGERIAGIERRVTDPKTKVDVAAGYGVPWEEVIAVGDGLTDVPLLDRAGVAILVAGGEKAHRFAGRPYHVVPSLGAAIAAVAAAL